MGLSTKFTEVFGIEHPVVQGGMQWVGRAELVAAVANAGALGFLTALTQPTPVELANEIAKTRALTDKPFDVNLTILPTINPPPYDEYRQTIVDAGVKIVETAGSNPGPHLPMLHDNGVKVLHKCTSVRHAEKAQSLGAEGINMGSRFMCTVESFIHQNVKEAIVSGTELDTELIFRPLRNTAQVASNAVSREVVEILDRGGQFVDVKELVAGARGRTVYREGDLDAGIWSVGTSMGLINDIPTVGNLVSRIIAEAEDLIRYRLLATINDSPNSTPNQPKSNLSPTTNQSEAPCSPRT
ncbi:nitronate monooxygenase family protein [Mycobacterium sp. Aquia_216]|uniref:NAD(P)H-dependent flavin oxidoreductase n=1 Tax=Mycobacterium sp. Aquia_216 TaxID=2991729 RepID=UPI00227CDAF2|nr:nitronate monooxygenase family protein [Mycobacterium sp. Aquia_216]WAJ45330.1 nitronate monooxygenase family protein [Mycobacterium sp. Aquia_216]